MSLLVVGSQDRGEDTTADGSLGFVLVVPRARVARYVLYLGSTEEGAEMRCYPEQYG
jgi:hypothetical protein